MMAGLVVAMLALSLLFVQPAPDRSWPARLLLHAALLATCLLVAALISPAPTRGRCLAGLLAALLGVGVYAAVGKGWPRNRPMDRSMPWLAGGLLLAGLAIGSMRAAPMPDAPAGVLAVSLAMLLAGLLAALAGQGTRARGGALLLACNGLLLSACLLPGMGIAALASLLLIEGALLSMLLRRSSGDEPVGSPR